VTTGSSVETVSVDVVSTTVAASPAAVYDLVSDVTRWPYEIRPLDGGTCEVTETLEMVEQPGAVMRLMTKVATGVPWDQRMADLDSGMRTTLDGVRAAAERG
jgi:hypothetical protein